MAAVGDKALASATQCEYPMRFRRTELDQTTGEVRSREVLRRCGSRRSAECPSCSALYKGDALAVLRSELFDEADNVRTATWVTFTAPGADVFGQVHSQRRDKMARCARAGAEHGTPMATGCWVPRLTRRRRLRASGGLQRQRRSTLRRDDAEARSHRRTKVEIRPGRRVSEPWPRAFPCAHPRRCHTTLRRDSRARRHEPSHWPPHQCSEFRRLVMGSAV